MKKATWTTTQLKEIYSTIESLSSFVWQQTGRHVANNCEIHQRVWCLLLTRLSATGLTPANLDDQELRSYVTSAIRDLAAQRDDTGYLETKTVDELIADEETRRSSNQADNHDEHDNPHSATIAIVREYLETNRHRMFAGPINAIEFWLSSQTERMRNDPEQRNNMTIQSFVSRVAKRSDWCPAWRKIVIKTWRSSGLAESMDENIVSDMATANEFTEIDC